MVAQNKMMILNLLCAGVLVTSTFPDATVTHNGAAYTLANSYVQVVFSGASINSLKGDFQGKGQYGEVQLKNEVPSITVPFFIAFFIVHT